EKRSQYRIVRTINNGTYSVTKEAIGPPGRVVLKSTVKKNLPNVEQWRQAICLYASTSHPQFVRFLDWFETSDKFYVVTEIAEGGEVFEHLSKHGKYTEADALRIVRQLLQAVYYLHDRDIVHRDLKVEKLFYSSQDPGSPIVVASSGYLKQLEYKGQKLEEFIGSFGYTAPELMRRRGYDTSADMWSVGVITYTLLCGYTPFRSEAIQELIQECESEIIFHERYWSDVSDDAKEFILGLLKPNPLDRLTSRQALNHPWM
ncbi:Pkinase-domain-containing protein, partial [Thozetella sp. PMI_491]